MSYREEFLSRTSNPIPIAVFFPPQGQSSLKYNVPIAEIQVSYIRKVLQQMPYLGLGCLDHMVAGAVLLASHKRLHQVKRCQYVNQSIL